MLDVSQKLFTALAVLTFCAATLSLDCFAEEAEKTITVVTVSEICGGCVKKITKRFEAEKDVAKIECSIEKKAVTLVPKEGVKLNAKKVWEIMEGISNTPTKLVSPEGAFTTKPK
jgi:periplasmic mercuric ion binding protein